jgi:hypothetical protein
VAVESEKETQESAIEKIGRIESSNRVKLETQGYRKTGPNTEHDEKFW